MIRKSGDLMWTAVEGRHGLAFRSRLATDLTDADAVTDLEAVLSAPVRAGTRARTCRGCGGRCSGRCLTLILRHGLIVDRADLGT
jgi:hypothetical protein